MFLRGGGGVLGVLDGVARIYIGLLEWDTGGLEVVRVGDWGMLRRGWETGMWKYVCKVFSVFCYLCFSYLKSPEFFCE